MARKRLKVLAVAAAAHPEKGSEPGLGWGWIESLAKYHDLWVITGEREGNREAIEHRFEEVSDLGERLKIYYIPRPDGSKLEKWLPFLYYRRYRKWHCKAFCLAKELSKNITFDLAHQINMTGFREPGYLWKLNMPFVWGPVGGTANVPLRFMSVLGVRQFFYHLVKVVFNNLQLHYHRRVRKAVQRADGFVTSTSDTRKAFYNVYEKDSTVLADTGPPVQNEGLQVYRKKKKYADQRIRLSWSGIHVSRKALPLLLMAVSKLPSDLGWHLDIIGLGPMTAKWKHISTTLGIDQHCTWYGWIGKEKAIDIVANSDVFVFPSLHEGMPTVVMEALALGVPVICLEHCGQGDAVTSNCGIKIPVTSPREVVEKIADAIVRLYKDSSLLEQLSIGAVKRAGLFAWDKKAQKMLNVYGEAISHWEHQKVSSSS